MAENQHGDFDLIGKISRGDRQAFQVLFHRYYKVLLAIAINILKDVALAKDVTQEVFLSIWKKRSSLNIHSSVEAFLKRSVINRSLNQIKARKHFVPEGPSEDLPDHQNAALQLESKDLEKIIETTLATLPERCRLIFILRRIEGLSHKEIAEKLHISPKTVENQMTKALKVLKNAIQPYLEVHKNVL